MRRAVVGIAVLSMALSSVGAAWAAPADSSADMRITGSFGPAVEVGQNEFVDVGADNFGPDAATGVKVKVRFSDEFTYSSSTPPCSLASSNVVVCRFGKVPADSNPQASISLLAASGGRGRLTVAATSKTPDPDLTNNSAVWKVRVDAPVPALGVRPSTDLVNLEKVHIKLNGVPDDSYFIWECDGTFPAHGGYDCMKVGSGVYLSHYMTAMKTTVKVHTGPIGDVEYGGSCGTNADDNNCVITVSPYSNGPPDFTGMPIVPIAFALAT